MQRRNRLPWVLLAVVLVVNLWVGHRLYAKTLEDNGGNEGYEQLRQFTEVLHVIREYYVDPNEVGYPHLMHGALEGMLDSLDPFSSYISPENYQRMREQTEGHFGGIGVYLAPDLSVIAPIPGTPGARADLRAHDRILKVDDNDVVGMDLTDVIALIKGEPGTTVLLTLFRPDTEEELTKTVERAVIEIDSVRNVHFVEPGLGYVSVTAFNENTAAELLAGLAELERKGRLSGLVLDLRHNPGGLLDAAIEVCSIFLPQGELVVFTEGRKPTQREDFHASNGAKYQNLPVVILINGQSASAAEIVSGCLQDYHRATLVGQKSFGKGSVQSVIELSDGSAVRLTIAKYYTPSKRVIHGHGIEPDVEVKISEADAIRVYIQRNRIDGAEVADDEPEIPDVQLTAAIDAARAKMGAPAPAK